MGDRAGRRPPRAADLASRCWPTSTPVCANGSRPCGRCTFCMSRHAGSPSWHRRDCSTAMVAARRGRPRKPPSWQACRRPVRVAGGQDRPEHGGLHRQRRRQRVLTPIAGVPANQLTRPRRPPGRTTPRLLRAPRSAGNGSSTRWGTEGSSTTAPAKYRRAVARPGSGWASSATAPSLISPTPNRSRPTLMAPTGLLHVAFVRSPHAHAQVRSVTTEPARTLPGVVGVVAGADLQGRVAPLPCHWFCRA
jgi:hypothetical protein